MKRKSCMVFIILMIWGLALANVTLASYTKLYDFTSTESPYATGNLVMGTDGTLYGMTFNGGSSGLGTIFKFTEGAIILLHEFQGGADGKYPEGSLILSGDYLYGMTMGEGDDTNCDAGSCGTIFKIHKDTLAATNPNAIIPLHSFAGYEAIPSGGSSPIGNLTRSPNGDYLYGMTFKGGVVTGTYTRGAGTIFKISTESPNSITYLHNFTAADGDGSYPYGNLTLSSDGATLYGMTDLGGATPVVNTDVVRSSRLLRMLTLRIRTPLAPPFTPFRVGQTMGKILIPAA